jgi:small subunit ribosomal protein S8
MTDPIADMFTRLRNAAKAGHAEVQVPNSRIKREIAQVLVEAGYIAALETDSSSGFPELKLKLKYANKKPVIDGLKRVSTPSRRIYVGIKDIPRLMGGMGTVILSTPKGILTGKQARQQNVGGELLCFVW